MYSSENRVSDELSLSVPLHLAQSLTSLFLLLNSTSTLHSPRHMVVVDQAVQRESAQRLPLPVPVVTMPPTRTTSKLAFDRLSVEKISSREVFPYIVHLYFLVLFDTTDNLQAIQLHAFLYFPSSLDIILR